MALLIKKLKGLDYASVKSVNGLAVASIKSINGLDATGGSTTFVTGQGLTTLRSDAQLPVGFKFTVGGTGITITDLGRWRVSGNVGTHTLGIYSAIGGLMASVAIDMSSGTVGDYKFAAITPLALSASTVYYCFSDEQTPGDEWYEGDTTITVTSVATVNASAYLNVDTPTVGFTGSKSYGPVNFKYTI